MIVSPDSIQLIGSELAIRWQDGKESYFSLEMLRRNCPCARCAGEGDLIQPAQASKHVYTPQSFILQKMEPVGGYAISLHWADGHATGIYSWAYLRELDM